MKYVGIKKISGHLLFEKYYSQHVINMWCKMHGFFIEVDWSYDVECWAKDNNLIDGFVSDGFIILKVEIDTEKYVYCFKSNYDNIFKLTKISNGIKGMYAWCCINKTLKIWSGFHDTIEEAIENVEINNIVKQFNSMREVVEEYNL